MTEANKDEVDKCKQIAESASSSGDFAKATRFLQKAKRMCPEDGSLDALLAKAEEGESGGGGGASPSGGAGASAEGQQGTRQRASAAGSAPSAPARPGASSTRTDKAGRQYTAEHMVEVQRILRTKDYYEILSVPKDSPEDVLKKAYKKLALKLHPDKNKAPGAEEAFKKVSRAVQCLTDEEKKQMYDRYGDEEQAPRQHRHQYQQDFMTPEDLFNVFFGGGSYNNAGGGGGGQGGDANANAQRAQLFQLLPVVLLVLLTLVSNFAGKDSGSRFSFTPTGQYQNERTSAAINVPYYVANDFEEHYGEGTRALTDFEKQVEIYYVRNLHSECDYQEKVMYKKVMHAKRRNSEDELDKARNHPRPACKEIEKIKRKHQHTYRSAMHMGY